MCTKRILVAGATGYLGRYLVQEFKKSGYWVRALTRRPNALDDLQAFIDDQYIGEVTRPETLEQICDGVDYIISTVGITRQKDGLKYIDVDYQGNFNLLERAIKSGVSRFAYVSVYNAPLVNNLKIIRAKEMFVERLKNSGLDFTIIRPTGFYSDMLEFLQMARKGKVYLFGDGNNKMNPIHGADLARACVDSFGSDEKEINVGGPEILSYREIAETAFEALDKEGKILSIPKWLINLTIPVLRIITPEKIYGPIEFMASAMTIESVAPKNGEHKLLDFFKSRA